MSRELDPIEPEVISGEVMPETNGLVWEEFFNPDTRTTTFKVTVTDTWLQRAGGHDRAELEYAFALIKTLAMEPFIWARSSRR